MRPDHLGHSETEQEIQLIGLDGYNLTAGIEHRAKAFLYLGDRHISPTRATRVRSKIESKRLYDISMHIGYQHKPLVTHHYTDCIRQRLRDYDVIRDAIKLHRNGNLFFGCLIKYCHKPESSTYGKEKEKHKELLIHSTEQEVLYYLVRLDAPLGIHLISLFCRLSCGSISEDIVLIAGYHNATSDLYVNRVLLKVDLLHSTMKTTTCNNFSTFLKRILEITYFLLLLLLRTNHKEPHDCKDCNHHNEHRVATTLLGLCC